MEESLLLAAVAVIAFGLLQKLRARVLRSTDGAAAACRAVIADAAAEGLLAMGLGALGLGAVCRLIPGRPEGPAALTLALGLVAAVSQMKAEQKKDRAAIRAMVLAADLLGSFTAAAAAALTLSNNWGGEDARTYVLSLITAGAIASVAGTALTNRAARTEEIDPLAADLGSWTSALLLAIAALPLSWLMEDGLPAFGATVCGVLAGLLVTRLAAVNGPRRLRSAVVLTGAALAAWFLAGAFGVALAAVGMTAGAGPLTAAETLSLPLQSEPGILSASGREFAATASTLSLLALLAACAQVIGLDPGGFPVPQMLAALVVGTAVAGKEDPRGTAAGLTVGNLGRLFFEAVLMAALFLRR